ncbi:MAG: bifunctional nuclease family protein [Candidatus Hydrogenedentes bacterium]|nr:bifunctional nuclease family protein [Candidatus Hydrogenedentota bacterium]
MLQAEIHGIRLDVQQNHVVVLRHEERVMFILVGPAEAEAIYFALIKRDLGRPMTHDLICNLLAGLRGELRSINIYKLENDTFYAYLDIEQKAADGSVDQVLRVDSRPSDGMALAARVGCPIYVAEEVFDQVAQDESILEAAEPGDDADEPGDEPEDEPDFDV